MQSECGAIQGMTSTLDRSTSSGHRILSRIRSPFTSKSRNITDFAIEPDEPHKQYSPGDVVTGNVRLRVHKPIRVTHIAVCLHGFAQVYRHPGAPDEGPRANSAQLGSGRGKKSGEYHGNGFASLFEDEVVLCGDGRLAEGAYQFNFELEFPDRDLPSSIDFERGTISYMITATMTRPTTMSPVTTCERKVYFVERIDISPLYPPKPRTITLEPISKRSRARDQARKLIDPSEKKGRKADSAHDSGEQTPRQSEASSTTSAHTDSGPLESPEQSEVSLNSRSSGRDLSQHPDSRVRMSPTSGEGGKSSTHMAPLVNRVITATVESQTGGCLRGDSIPIRINVSHTKHVRSLYGVIVTLYRQARVDMRPAIPIGTTKTGKDDKFEDYFPKSVTGLGGLSLSGAASSHVFRKDLAQVMAPLMVDPQTLAAEINTKLRVPEEAFPTISTVPGAMISFKYYVEVVLDIQGKLAGQDRGLGSFADTVNLSGHHPTTENPDIERSAFGTFGSAVIDTAPIRRDKSVVTCTFEVIVGTRDSERRKGKRKMMEMTLEPEPTQPQARQDASQQAHGAGTGTDWSQSSAYYDSQWHDQQYSYPYPEGYHTHGQPDAVSDGQNYADYPPPPIPPPQSPNESQLTDKQRMQHAETRLLPSQPPGMDGEQVSEGADGATAPFLPDESGGGIVLGNWESPGHSPMPAALATMGQAVFPRQMTRAPEYEPPGAGSLAPPIAADDKLEMRQRELHEEASAPPVDDESSRELSPTAPDNEASVPTLNETNGPAPDVFDSHANAVGYSGLPRYER